MAERDLFNKTNYPNVSEDTKAFLDDIRHRESTSVLKTGIEKVAALVTSDTQMQQEIAQYTAAGLKTGALFFRGRVGLAGSVGLFGLDEMNPNRSAGEMLLEGGVGAMKGGASKLMFDKIGDTSWNPAVKALGLGVGTRMTDAAFRADTYRNDLGQFAPVAGMKNAFASAFDKQSLGTDLVTFGLAYGAFKGVDSFTRGGLSTNRIASTAFLGGSFGIVSGAHGELRNQMQSGGQIDFAKVAARGLMMGAVDAVAALPAGFQGVARMRPPKEFEAQRMQEVRTHAKANNLWLMEVPKPVFEADGTPVVAPLRGNMTEAFQNARNMATSLDHPISLDWNSVRVRVEPRASQEQVHEAYNKAYNDPARLAEVKRQDELFQRRSREQMSVAEREIDALRGRPAREPEILMRDLTNANPSNWAAGAMSSLRHPTEIESFARAYARFDPEAAIANLKEAGRFAQPGTQKVWEDVTKRIERSGAGDPNAGEAKLFGDIRNFENLTRQARQHDLWLQQIVNGKPVVMPQGPSNISEAGTATGRYAAAIKGNVYLNFNEKLIEVKPNASGADVEAAYFKKK